MIASFCVPAYAAEMPDECVEPVRELAKSNALEVACETAEITKKILAGDANVVPPALYHFGKRDLLEMNAKENNIPKDAWDNSIMGEVNRRFKIQPIRRGLYGTHEIETNSFYSPGSYDWMMEIRIKPECRKPGKVVSLARLQDDPRFEKWITSTGGLPLTTAGFRNECNQTTDYMNVYEKAECREIAERFLKEADIKVIQDHIINRSFYIRDRNCVEGIRAKPADVVRIFAENPSLWIKSCSAYDFYGSYYRFTPLLYKVLVHEDLSDVDEDTLDQLLNNTKLLNAGDDSGRNLLDSLVRSYVAARREGKASEWQTAMRKVPTLDVADAPAILPKPLVERVKARMLE